MNYFIKIEIDQPPEGATHYNTVYALKWEKRVDGEIYIWAQDKWHKLSEPQLGRNGSYPIQQDDLTIQEVCDHDWEDMGEHYQCTYPDCQKIKQKN